VNNTFPSTAVVNPSTGLTQSAIVPTGEGNVDLLNGPYRYMGFVPKSAADLSSPLAFQLANPPRQISFALRFVF
jgi:F420-0:gamma-glutamyl ligase-like protein